MPQVYKIRGRRAEKKRKREEDEEASELERPRPNDATDVENVVDGHRFQEDATARPPDIPFYGMLDENDQEYFKRADSMLELNQFANAEERAIFLASVYKEAKGKELRIANSQSCSRLLERLICISTPTQLKALFRAFSGQ
jgi:nucleolar protein 9